VLVAIAALALRILTAALLEGDDGAAVGLGQNLGCDRGTIDQRGAELRRVAAMSNDREGDDVTDLRVVKVNFQSCLPPVLMTANILTSFSGLKGLGFLQSGPIFRVCRDVVHASCLDYRGDRGRGYGCQGKRAFPGI
jgi:hypothetical protein